MGKKRIEKNTLNSVREGSSQTVLKKTMPIRTAQGERILTFSKHFDFSSQFSPLSLFTRRFNRGRRGALWYGLRADITDGSQTPPHRGPGTYTHSEIGFEWGGAKMESRPAGTNPSQWFPYAVLSAAINWSHFRQTWNTHLPLLLALGQGGERFS